MFRFASADITKCNAVLAYFFPLPSSSARAGIDANCVSRDISALDPGPPSSLPTNPDTKVDISSLTWEDKERVLRLLFGKINNVQVCTRSLGVKTSYG